MIEQANSSITYIADGVQTEWEYPYPYVENDDINLYITVDNVRTKISQDSFSFDSSTKKVTFPLAGEPVVSGAYVEISREIELTQLEDSSIVAFKSNDVERIADKLTMICQDTQRMVKDAISPEGGQIQEAVSEAISVHNNSVSSHPLKEDKANKVTSISDSSTDTQYPSAKVVNTELNKKQPKTLSESITINGTVITTVEGALNAINENSSIANISLSNLDSTGEAHFADPSFSNINANAKKVVFSREFTPLNTLIAQGGSGIAGEYTLADLPNDGKIRMALFTYTLETTQNGASSMQLETDCLDFSNNNHLEVVATNNGFVASGASFLPIKQKITIKFGIVDGGVSNSTRVILLGYF